MSNRIPIIATAVIIIVVAVFAATRGGTEDEPPPVAQYRAESTTTEPVGPAVIVEDGPFTEDEFVDAEAENEADRLETTDGAETVDLDLSGVDRSDPLAVAQAWGCAYRASPANEGSTAWVGRLSPLATPDVATKLDVVSENATPSVVVSNPTGVVADRSGAENTFRVDCEVITSNPDGERVLYDSATPISVVLTETDSGWTVSDFAFAGVTYGPLGLPGA